MNVKFAFSALACAVVLMCAAGGEAKALSTGATAAEGFSCESGLSVQIRRLSSEKIELSMEGKSAVLALDASGSGERYVSKQGLFGKGAEWQQKGGQAAFSFTDPYGNVVETTCNSTGAAQQASASASGAVERFSCESGLAAYIRRLPSEKIELTLEDKSAVLELDVSGSGERYVSKQGLFGKGTEWQQKGGQAALSFTDPYGNAVETTCHKDGD